MGVDVLVCMEFVCVNICLIFWFSTLFLLSGYLISAGKCTIH